MGSLGFRGKGAHHVLSLAAELSCLLQPPRAQLQDVGGTAATATKHQQSACTTRHHTVFHQSNHPTLQHHLVMHAGAAASFCAAGALINADSVAGACNAVGPLA
jgi:hypothetical protein